MSTLIQPSSILPDIIKGIIPSSFLRDLDGVFGITNYQNQYFSGGYRVTASIVLVDKQNDQKNIVLSVPSMPDFSIVIEELGEIEIVVGTISSITFRLGKFSIRIPEKVLKPVKQKDGKWIDDSNRESTEIDVEYSNNNPTPSAYPISLSIDTNGVFEFLYPKGSHSPLISLNGLSMIAQSGVVIVVKDISFNFDFFNPEIKFKRAEVILPQMFAESGVALPEIKFEKVIISQKGFTGKTTANWPLKYKKEENIFVYELNQPTEASILGISGGVDLITIDIKENHLIESLFKGEMLIPYFDEPVEVDFNLKKDGDFTITLTSIGSDEIELTKEELISFYIKALSVGKKDDDVSFKLDGGFEPLLWSLDWPRFDVKGFSIEKSITDLNEPPKIKFEEAWVDLKEIATLDLFGFHFELNKIGLGYVEDTDKLWIDLTGNLKLIDAIPVGVGVEGFRITWPRRVYEDLGIASGQQLLPKDILDIASKIEVKFDGVHLQFGIPETVEFEGIIKFIKEAQKVGFAGDAELRVPSTGLMLEAGILVGMNFEDPAYPFLFLSFGIVLPAGIPLAQSGLALKGAQGLLGFNVKPDIPAGANPYYDWYKKVPEGAHKATKWTDERSSFAFGAGITITTADGVLMGLKGLLVLVVPGPVIMIEGKALVFSGVFPGDGPLKGLAYIDGNNKTIQVNIEASMELMEGMVDVNANIEAFFDFNDPSKWHLFLGNYDKESNPAIDRRIHANILKIPSMGWLFQGQFYLMFDMEQESTFRVRTGIYIALPTLDFNLSVASLKFKAILDGTGLLTVNPFEFAGDIGLEANLDIKAFGFNAIGAEASANVNVVGALPLIVDANVHVHVDLPVPDLDDTPIVGDIVSWFEEEVTELPDIPNYLDLEVPFHWEYNGLPEIPELVKAIAVENYFSLQSDELKLHFAELNGVALKNEVHNSPIVALDSKPTIVFDQDMNQTGEIEGFAGYISNEIHTFKLGATKDFPDGLVTLKPTIREINIYKIEKSNFDSNNINWGDPIVTAASDLVESRLQGFWRAESLADNGNTPSKRVLRLNTNNPFDFVNSIYPVTNNNPTEDSGFNSPFIEGLINGGGFTFTDDKKDCFEKENWIGEEELGELYGTKTKPEIVREDDSYTFQYAFLDNALIIQSQDLNTSQVGDKNFLHTSTPNGNTPVLRLKFKEDVVGVDIIVSDIENIMKGYKIVCRRPEIKEKPTKENKNNTINEEATEYITESVDVTNIGVELKDHTLQLTSESGFTEVNLYLLAYNNINIENISYVTKKEIEDCDNRNRQIDANNNCNTQEIMLSSNSYYKIEVVHEISRIDNVGIPDIIVNLLANFYPELVSYKTSAYFQTDGPLADLSKYIKWTNIEHRKNNFFYEDDFVIRFNRSYINKLYPDIDNTLDSNIDFPFEIEAILKSSDGKIIDGFFHNWTKAESNTLLAGEKDWKKLFGNREDNDDNTEDSNLFTERDDILELRKYLHYSEHIPLTLTHPKVLNLSKYNTLKPKWNTNNGVFRSRNRIYDRNRIDNGGSLITIGDTKWSDYTFSFKMQGDIKNGKNGAAFYVKDKQNYYLVEFNIDLTIGKRSQLFPQLIFSSVVDGNKKIIETKQLDNISFETKKVTIKIDVSQNKKYPDSNNIEINVNEMFNFSFERVNRITSSGKIGFYSVNNNSVVYSDISVVDRVKSLLPSSRYELLLTGGEGGKMLIKDDQFSEDNWAPPKESNTGNTAKFYKNELEDFELIANLKSIEEETPVELYLRYPGESRSNNNKSYYILRISRSGLQLIYTLINKNIGETLDYNIENSQAGYNENIKLRVRFIGNQISVWVFEKLLFKVSLTDFSRVSGIENVAIRNINRINSSLSYIESIGIRERGLSNKISPKKKINFKTAYDGLIGFNNKDKIASIEIKEAYLYKTRFMTSKFANISALVEGYDRNIECLEVKNLNNISMQEFKKSKLKSYLTKVKFENKVVEEGKLVDRDIFEIVNQEFTAEEKKLDENFYNLVSKIGNGDLAYEKNPNKLILRILKENTEFKGIYLHAPEPLNIKFSLEGQIDTCGRMELLLKNADNNIINCFLLHNADSTKLLILPKDQNGNITSLLTGVYTLNFNYTRDYKDDDNEKLDHLFDRTYEMNRSSKNKYEGSIKLGVFKNLCP